MHGTCFEPTVQQQQQQQHQSHKARQLHFPPPQQQCHESGRAPSGWSSERASSSVSPAQPSQLPQLVGALALPDVAPFDENATLTAGVTLPPSGARRDRKRKRVDGRPSRSSGGSSLHSKQQHQHRAHKHRTAHRTSDSSGRRSDPHSTHKQHSKDSSRRSRRARKQRQQQQQQQQRSQHSPTADTPQPTAAQQSQHASTAAATAPLVAVAGAAVAVPAAAEDAAVLIERWVRSWSSSGTTGDQQLVISKVADKVKKEWDGKDRTGVNLHMWLTANPKRQQQAHALLTVYERKQRRGAHSNGA